MSIAAKQVQTVQADGRTFVVRRSEHGRPSVSVLTKRGYRRLYTLSGMGKRAIEAAGI